MRGLLGFGANMLMAHGDARRGREALAALDFYAHARHVHEPKAELADVILPVGVVLSSGKRCSFGFESTWRRSRSSSCARRSSRHRRDAPDTNILFALAERLGLGAEFWNGDIDAGYRAQLAPSGVTLEAAARGAGRRARAVADAAPQVRRAGREGRAPGFRTPSRKVEL